MNNLLPHPDEIAIADDVAEDPFNTTLTFDDPDLYTKIQEAVAQEQYHPREYLIVMPSVRPIPWEYYQTLSEFDFFICDDSDGRAPRHNMMPGQWNSLYYHKRDTEEDIPFMRVFLADRVFTEKYVEKENLWLFPNRSEERRVGKECRSRWSRDH